MILILVVILILIILLLGISRRYHTINEPFIEISPNLSGGFDSQPENISKLPKTRNNANIAKLVDYVNKLVKKNFKNEKIVKLTKKPDIKCKYFSSYSQGYVCPEKYSVHSGAILGAPCSSGLLCNGKKIKADRAKVYGIVKNGRIDSIKILNKGSGYIGKPKVKILGNGNNAEAICQVDRDGGISNIKIINPGQNYTETPKIKIEKPNGYMYCHLCCNKLTQ